ncbi:YIP1 family protein [Sulfitobacter sp. S0837]|uniref:YIP1 family protein n=1 Tax=Sulfitobacter maritimus TaxID=2741719 RepID=UPI0015838AA6|nr:YIP1 family protein [Sulfitobacter maritimus]NUH64227.1 YIP1 family protein [Sulfitobacter maritimus]
MLNALLPLAQTTLRDPRAAAAMIASVPIERNVLWMGVALIAALNALVISATFVLAPPAMVLPGYFHMPLALFVLLAGLMVLYVHALYWVGRAMGGQGRVAPLLASVVWLQFLRLVAQLGVIVLTFALPPLALLASVVVTFWGLWILLNFVAEILALPGLFHAAAVLAGAALGVVLGLGFLLSLIGLTAQGV